VIEAMLFDLDGTLADTAPDMARTVNIMRTKRGLAPVPLERVRPHGSHLVPVQCPQHRVTKPAAMPWLQFASQPTRGLR